MNRTTTLAVICASALILHGCASAEETLFSKRGMSLTAQKSDSAQCWKLAQKTNLTDDQATQNVVAGVVVGGLVGGLLVSSANEEARKDPQEPIPAPGP